MLLTANLGNTAVSLALFDGDALRVTMAFSSDFRTADDAAAALLAELSLHGITADQITGSILSSVVPAKTDLLARAVETVCGFAPLFVSAGVRTGLNLKVHHAAMLGSDLVAQAVGAAKLGELPCVIASLGTATTIVALDEQGSLIGTSVSVGVESGLRALHRDTANLPEVGLQPVSQPYGTDTAQALRVGALVGTAALLDGMADRMGELFSRPPALLLTGRQGEALLPYLRRPYRFEPHLLSRGLAAIFEKNQSR